MPIQEVAPDLFRLEIPFPDSPLRSVNAYVIRGDRSLVVDPGPDHPECRRVFLEGLESLGVAAGECDFVLTHAHPDHWALARALAGEGTAVYLNGADGDFLRRSAAWDARVAAAETYGFPIRGLRKAFAEDPLIGPTGDTVFDFVPIEDGSRLSVGRHRFRCIATPGHTPGHTCLYDADRRVLLAGDHLLGDIATNITCWSEDGNPLADYLRSLERAGGLDVSLVLPGHRRVFGNHRDRVRELVLHHRQRVREVSASLSAHGRTAYEVASGLSWDGRSGPWESWPLLRRWFATGQTIAYLRFLEGQGGARCEARGGVLSFLAPPP